MAAWEALRVRVRREDAARVSRVLFALGASGVQEDYLPGEAPPPRQPWERGPPAPQPPEVLLRTALFDPDRPGVEGTLRDVVGSLLGPDAIEWGTVEEVDWEARFRAGFTSFAISDRLVIAPPWDAPVGAVVVEPGCGFGTGAHPTTRQALRALDALADQAETALDIGCGSGILALAAAHLGLHARGIDVDRAAIGDARANAARNGLEIAFSTERISGLRVPADLVLANLHAELLVELSMDLLRLTGRWLVLAGILQDREILVRKAFASLAPHLRFEEGEWVCLVLRRER
ncbi:MAG: 50S ribosomal protein L11 methyltransferase [Deltaproteobacteria bacterium]|nr:50S ribosomal protein L11 methyltransferase [Deltaproteobacteria bacterium]